ncbi:hypothetical protein [Arthrobacter bambusae]|uniref:hypothetical protein n=1 Tax=Arthrobacter bambusae TaxID=1338426 RepID=UPI002783988C|nr:hypothetical protein [Arthrobacter bambusae]MDQ0030488.1 hypothetical protein [Arthrobacter bambusae]MDQ0098405.1 hypothetical protein [Arthrobacter bambusae]
MDTDFAIEDTEDISPLASDLADEQIDLLTILWRHLVEASRDPDGPVWPVWHYVDVMYSHGHPQGLGAMEVLKSLPRITRPDHAGADYGLVWWEEASQPWPLANSKIGLSIAGLSQLGRHGSNSTSVADALVKTVSSLAEAQAAVPPNAHLVPTVQRRLADFIGNEFAATAKQPFEVPLVLIGALLQKEYAHLNILQNDGFTVNIMGPDLRPFAGLSDAVGYLNEISKDAAARVEPLRHVAPLPLIQTIDYLSYVLNDDPVWKSATPRKFAEAPNLASAAALSAASHSQDQFESNIGALWNLVGNFSTPKADSEEMERLYGKDASRSSLNQLEWWLRQHLDNRAFERTKSALAQIRDIGKIRNGIAHASADKRKQSLQAQQRLGIPAVVTQWEIAWETIKSTLAGALEVIREEVQMRDRAADS